MQAPLQSTTHTDPLRLDADGGIHLASRRVVAADAAQPQPVSKRATARFERSLVVIVAVFGPLWALQMLRPFFADLHTMNPVTGAVAVSLAWLSVIGGPVAAVIASRARLILLAAVGAYVAAIIVWPLAVEQPIPLNPLPWFAAVAGAPMAYLAVAVTRPAIAAALGTMMAAASSVILGTVGGLGLNAILPGVLMGMLSIVLALVVSAVRRIVRKADEARVAAVAGWARTKAEDATESERKRTDALLHDVVLTTFLSAASTTTPEAEDLVRRMASNALRVLAHVHRAGEEGLGVPFSVAWARMSDQVEVLQKGFALRAEGSDGIVLPADVADVMLTAMVEAMTNSVQHGQATTRELRLSALGADGLRIEVRDDGIGFDRNVAVQSGRGLQTMVLEPLRRVAGRADIDTAPGRGCVVTLSWGSVVMWGVDPLSNETIVARP